MIHIFQIIIFLSCILLLCPQSDWHVKRGRGWGPSFYMREKEIEKLTPPHLAAISNCQPHKSEITYSGFSQGKQESS